MSRMIFRQRMIFQYRNVVRWKSDKVMSYPEPTYQQCISGCNIFRSSEPFEPEYGGVLRRMELAYETWGTLNEDRSNGVLLHTGLTASSHARSHPGSPSSGWWEDFIGPGRALDTDKYFVICSNILGGCFGSTGPSSINPDTGLRYATQFPIVTVGDMVRAQFRMLDSLDIKKLHASIGSSLGGMQSLLAAALFPERVGRIVTISSSARSQPFSIALRYSQRRVLMGDPMWNGGYYYDGPYPSTGMKLAREIATISYRSGPEWEQRFGNRRTESTSPAALAPDFLIEQYLAYQGNKFLEMKYDPNSLIYISKAMDLFDMSIPDDKGELNLCAGLGRVKCPVLVIGVQSDILFPCFLQRDIANNLKASGNKQVTYYELDALYGHDTFLIDQVNVGSAVKGHLEMDVSSFL